MIKLTARFPSVDFAELAAADLRAAIPDIPPKSGITVRERKIKSEIPSFSTAFAEDAVYNNAVAAPPAEYGYAAGNGSAAGFPIPMFPRNTVREHTAEADIFLLCGEKDRSRAENILRFRGGRMICRMPLPRP